MPWPSTAAGDVVLSRRVLYMLPTRHGWTLALVLVVLLLAGINYGNSLVYGLTFLLAGMAVVSMLITDRNLLHLHVRVSAGAPVIAGEPAVFRVHLLNHGTRTRFAIALVQEKREVGHTDIAAGATAALELRVLTSRRGWLKAPTYYVSTRFPIGILYSWSRRVTPEERCLVYPRPSDPWPWREHANVDSSATARPTTSGDDFSGVREYRPGDSPRQIDWKSAARGRGWLTKEFAVGLSETLSFDLNQIPGPDLETRLSMLCRALLDAEQEGARYSLTLGATAIAANSGEAHQQRCLTALALYGLDDR